MSSAARASATADAGSGSRRPASCEPQEVARRPGPGPRGCSTRPAGATTAAARSAGSNCVTLERRCAPGGRRRAARIARPRRRSAARRGGLAVRRPEQRRGPGARRLDGDGRLVGEPVRRRLGHARDGAQPRADAAAAKQPASHACSPAPPISQSTSQTRGVAPSGVDEHVLPSQVPVDELRRSRAARRPVRRAAAVRALERLQELDPRRAQEAEALGVGPVDATPPRSQSERGASCARVPALGVELAERPSDRGGHAGLERASAPHVVPKVRAGHGLHLELVGVRVPPRVARQARGGGRAPIAQDVVDGRLAQQVVPVRRAPRRLRRRRAAAAPPGAR